MAIAVNGQVAATGAPGTYVALNRDWAAGDTVELELPIGLRLLRYHGVDCPRWHARYAILYGPLLLSVVGPPGDLDPHLIELARDPEDFPAWMIPVADQPLRWRIAGCPEHVVMPYWEVERSQRFTCYPVLSGSR
jgi:hypothetical protein